MLPYLFLYCCFDAARFDVANPWNAGPSSSMWIRNDREENRQLPSSTS